MAFDAGSIVANLKLNTKGFTSSLDAVQKKIGKVGTAFVGAFGVNQMAELAQRVGRLAVQFEQAAERGAMMQEVDMAFKRVTASVEEANQILQGTRRVTNSLANNEIKQLANRLDLVGISAEKLPKLAEIAEAIADSTGQSTREVLDTIISGTARMSDRMLKLIGINVELMEGLSETEKQQAFLNQVLSQGDDIINRLGNSIDTNADKIDRWKTSWKNLFETIDKGAANTFGAFASTIGTPKGLLALLLGRFDLASPAVGMSLGGGGAGGGDFGQFGNVSRTGPFAAQQQALLEKAKAAQAAAKAYFDALLARGGRSPSSTTPTPRIGTFDPSIGIDQGDVSDPGLSMGQGIIQNFINPVGDALGVLGDSFSSFFEEVITGSGNAGRAFFNALTQGLAGVASAIGDLFIQTAIGMINIPALNPFALLGAGFALKALAGIFRGVGNKNAPSFSTATSPTRPRGSQFDEEKRQTTIVIDNFVGGESLIEFINKIQRNTGARIVVHGRA